MKKKPAIKSNKFRGFTLIEFAIVLLISALILSSSIEAYRVYHRQNIRQTVLSDMDAIKVALSAYSSAHHGYPCPAPRTLDINDPKAGISDCSWKTGTIGTCDPSTGICLAGGRDTIYDADTNPDGVLIGAVPFRTILKDTTVNSGGFNKAAQVNTVDPYGYQYTYAVTSSLTETWDKLPSGYGAISIETETGKSIISPAGSALYAVVAHGENHMGAYTAGGVRNSACTAGTADYKNCTDSATFVDSVYNLGAGANYYDDIVSYLSYSITTLWDYIPNPADSSRKDDIYNVNVGNVGVGSDTPTEKLTVGDFSGSNSGVVRSSDDVVQQELCDSSGNNCWDPSIFAGPTGISCAASVDPTKAYVVTGIKNGTVSCSTSPIDLPKVTAGQTCPSGQYVYNVKSNGNIQCKSI